MSFDVCAMLSHLSVIFCPRLCEPLKKILVYYVTGRAHLKFISCRERKKARNNAFLRYLRTVFRPAFIAFSVFYRLSDCGQQDSRYQIQI